MRPRDEKAGITKAVNRYLKNNVSVKKIDTSYITGSGYSVIITPGSDMLLLKSFNEYDGYVNRVSVPRFSDYVVRNNGYIDFMSKLKEGFNAKT